MGPGGRGSDRVISHRIQVSTEQLLQEVQKSWAIENSGMSDEQDSIQDIRARKIMDSAIKLTEDGHYEMGLLWKYDEHNMPHSKTMAESRLASLRRRLVADQDLHKEYTEVIEGYISSGYAKLVGNTVGTPGKSWYLPHHPVVHPSRKR